MAKALIFPGQGSQFVGMGKLLAQEFSEALEVFQEVDDVLGQNLSKIIFDGPQEELNLTINTQPALMACSIAVLRVMESLGFLLKKNVSFVAGHSLGEYSALCASGMFSLKDTTSLLRIRAHAMQEAVPLGRGGMAAIIGLDQDVISAICLEVSVLGICQVANDNGAGQFVISGNRDAVEHALVLAGERGGRSVMLPVSAPFHSGLMKPAAEAMRFALEGVTKMDPIIPIVMNVLAEPEQDCLKITQCLIEQVMGLVRWRETVEWFADHGIKNCFEIGSGRVLTCLTGRMKRGIQVMPVCTIEDIESAIRVLGV
ncbi:MAG: [acyl-carrier-protein] S-malonyltransferase [Candidatus Tokpelaia sp. JSC161]|nr:MAG: [acyl-carrier-protein] S-malonyltransferase [Candidatus Tokpelaia sp. JSC161]